MLKLYHSFHPAPDDDTIIPSMNQKHILIIDDEAGFVEFVSALLLSRGYRVSSASNGQEGLKRLKSGDPDLLILDMTMPKMGGVEFYTRICSQYGRTRFPVIVLTALDGLNAFFQAALVDSFMTKPFQIGRLMAEVDRLLSGASKPLVLLADDDTAESARIREALEIERFQVEAMKDPDQASARRPDFVLMDSGWNAGRSGAALQRIKQRPDLKGVPVITYAHAAANGSQGSDAGADRNLGKLEDLHILFSAMREFQLQQAREAQEKA